MQTIWVVVADEAIARILEWPDTGGELEPVEELTDPQAHASSADLRRDAHGRRAGSAPQGSRQNTAHRLRGPANVTSSAGEAERHLEADAFARRVAERLAEARREGRFDSLRIVAAPRFLGILRKLLSPEVARCVTDDLARDLVHMNNRDISERLFPRKAERP
jgi:protein required for attachment to host cells